MWDDQILEAVEEEQVGRALAVALTVVAAACFRRLGGCCERAALRPGAAHPPGCTCPSPLPAACAHPAAAPAAVLRLQVGGAGSVEELAEALALRLARTAHRLSLDPTFLSPFTAELQERAGPDMGRILPQSGGKADDVTAVVALVARG